MSRALLLLVSSTLLVSAGCLTTTTSSERSAFETFTEQFGDFDFTTDDQDTTGGQPTLADATFRSALGLTFSNNAPAADLETSFVAWVNASSISNASQEDTLLNSGYVQLTTEARLGSAFVLPVGTFVFNGAGMAGATRVRLGAAGAGAAEGEVTPSTRTYNLVTPDVILVFKDPPVSCESPAFVFTQDGRPIDSVPVDGTLGDVFEGTTGLGGIKTLAQVDVYQCEPLRPGLFFRGGGGVPADNEYREGANITFSFFLTPNADGLAANVTVTP